MKVRDLITVLQRQDPEQEVELYVDPTFKRSPSFTWNSVGDPSSLYQQPDGKWSTTRPPGSFWDNTIPGAFVISNLQMTASYGAEL